MEPAWLHLNQIIDSPAISPANGSSTDRSLESLSNPVPHSEVLAQLEAWTNVTFDFEKEVYNSDWEPHPTPHQRAQDRLLKTKGKSFEHGFGNGNALGASAFDPQTSNASLIDPLLAFDRPQFSNDFFRFDDNSNALLSPINGGPFADVSETPLLASRPIAFADIDTAFPSIISGELLPGDVATPDAEASPAVSAISKSPSAYLADASSSKPAKAGSRGRGKRAISLEDADSPANPVSVEEDKRKRNTAASARFRIKKKEREQALQKNAKEMQDRISQLEKDVDTLRHENTWLRNLIVEKAKSNPTSSTPSTASYSASDTVELPSAKRSKRDIAT